MTKWGGFYSRGLRTGSRDRRGDNDGPPLLLILPNNIVLLLVAIARRRRRPPTSILEDKEKRVAVEYLGRSEAADDLGRGARVGYAGSKGARDIEGGRGRRAAVGRRGIGEVDVHGRRRHDGGRVSREWNGWLRSGRRGYWLVSLGCERSVVDDNLGI